MGQNGSEQLKDKNIDLSNWIEAVEDPNNSLFSNVNPFRKRLLVNKKTKQLIEQYELQFLSQDDFSSYSNEIEQRKEKDNIQLELLSSDEAPYRVCPYIYKVKQFTNTSVDELCSTIYNGLLYISKVELRLKQINDIPFSDQLYLYRACLQGFRVLYEQVGYFDITEEMIFANREGKVKVWMNPNLSKHHPNYEPDINQNPNYTIEMQGSQSQMLKNLIKIIQVNADTLDHKVHFRQYLRNKGIIDRLSFYKAIDEFHQYVQQNHYHVNNHMKSIYDLFHEDGNLYHSQTQNSLADNPHKDYESLKNSNLSFYNNPINSQKKNTTSNIGNQLADSRASKHSFNSEFTMKKINSQARINHLKNSVHDKIDHYQNPIPNNHFIQNHNSKLLRHNNMASNAFLHSRTLPPVPSQHQVQPRNLYPQNKMTPQSDIVKYKSLQKSHLIPAQRPITFSYQIQNHTTQVITEKSTAAKQTQVIDQYRKVSIIDKLNTPMKIGSKNSEKTMFDKKSEFIEGHGSSNHLNYYSNSQIFELDSEIAEDMLKYLGVNPNLI